MSVNHASTAPGTVTGCGPNVGISAAPDWFRTNTHRYDKYDRHGPKVFAGEYAAQSVNTGSPENRNNWECALAEAAFLTGLVRNSDVVAMASYAPLFAHVDAWQWRPNGHTRSAHGPCRCALHR